MKLPRTGLSPNAGIHRIAVDASAKPVRIWLPYVYNNPARLSLHRGRRRQVRGQGRSAAARTCGREGPRDLTVDRVRGEALRQGQRLHGKFYRLDDRTGDVKDVIDLSRCHRASTGHPAHSRRWTATSTSSTGARACAASTAEGKDLNWDGQNTHSHPHRAA